VIDLLLINVPRISLVYPPAGTSLLKGVVEQQGFTCTVKDANFELLDSISDPDDFETITNYFTIPNAEMTTHCQKIIDDWYTKLVNYILKLNPKHIGISVFTFECQVATRELCKLLRQVYKGKIIIGGAGLSTTGIATQVNDFGNTLLESNLVDYYVRGEGEYALVDILKENKGAGINNDSYVQIEDLNSLAYPNYDDVIKYKYHYAIDNIQLPITTSRGCVRRCSFCDIHAFWKKYTYRSGENIALEMITHYEKYGVRDFFFTDSLINGNLKSFRQLCNWLVDYYKKNNLPDKFFSWGGQWIVRTEKHLSPEDYKTAAKSGMNGLAMGIESLSEQIRVDMNKGFKNIDLDYTLEQFRLNDMNCYFLMIVGYPTEKEEHHLETMQNFVKYQGYAIDGTIFGVNLGGTLSIDEGSPLHQNSIHFGLQPTSDNEELFGLDWTNKENPTLTLLERINRRIDLQELLMDLGYTVWNGDHQLKRLKASYERIKQNTYHFKDILHS
jgi:hypothetical protein